MQAPLFHLLGDLRFAPAQTHLGATVLPIVGTSAGPGPEYLTLGEALTKSLLTITELNEGGSVPHLKVHNDAECPVLILDGEELLGAKQNRVVNTTILLKEKSVTIIPVSCTEQGRWSYRSARFEDSDVVMYHKARSRKVRSVSESLRSHRGFQSDQGEVWNSVAEMHCEVGTASPTGAMRDAYTARRSRLDEWEDVFGIVPGQLGMAIVANGRVLGVEFVSRSTAYSQLHRRLLRSYALDVSLDETPAAPMNAEETVAVFLASLDKLEEHSHASIGYGTDWRYDGENTCGAILAYDDTCIHAAFFEAERSPRRRAPRPYATQRPRPDFTGSPEPAPRPAPAPSRPASPPPAEPSDIVKALQKELRQSKAEAAALRHQLAGLERGRKRQRLLKQGNALDAAGRLRLVAENPDVPLAMLPAAWAEVEPSVLATLDPGIRQALRNRLQDRKNGPWMELLTALLQLDPQE